METKNLKEKREQMNRDAWVRNVMRIYPNKTKQEIEVQWPEKSLGEARDFAERFGCTASKTKHRGYFLITTDDPVNFYWLGANIHNAHFNQCQQSAIAKFTEL